jgi:hypothetical protein
MASQEVGTGSKVSTLSSCTLEPVFAVFFCRALVAEDLISCDSLIFFRRSCCRALLAIRGSKSSQNTARRVHKETTIVDCFNELNVSLNIDMPLLDNGSDEQEEEQTAAIAFERSAT